tara:strand:- start:480 stop:713 length:234 start_codon:yes stop_codon:yes gene_type:complete
MYKQRLLSYIKILNYKEPNKIYTYIYKNIYKNIPTIEEKINIEKINIGKINIGNKNIDINDINYSKNFWENIKKYKN